MRTLTCALTLAASVAIAQTADKKSETKPAAPAVATPGQAVATPGPAGWTVFIDPVTKKMRPPTDDEMQTLMSGRTASAVFVPKPVSGPKGAIGMTVDPALNSFSVATIGPDGKLKTDCVPGEAAAKAIVEGAQIEKKKVTLEEK